MKKEILFYKKSDGTCPIEEFLDTLTKKDVEKVLWILRLLEDPDIAILPIKYFKKLVNTNNIWECKVKCSSNSYRIFCFFFESDKIVITHGYVKKSQKTNPREIRKAENYKTDFIKQKEKENE
jgi:phage-related protein